MWSGIKHYREKMKEGSALWGKKSNHTYAAFHNFGSHRKTFKIQENAKELKGCKINSKKPIHKVFFK